jgi:hypothetical protein
MIRMIPLNARNVLYYDTDTGAWAIDDDPPAPDTPDADRPLPRRVIFTTMEERGIVATRGALAAIDMLPERVGFLRD